MLITYAQNFEDIMLWRALGHVANGFYIDVGANDPNADSVSKLFYERGWNGINVEPLQRHIEDLRRARPRDINLQCAVSAQAGEIRLWDCGVRGWATVNASVVERHVAEGYGGRYVVVPSQTLTIICESHARSEIHFLKVDVEGHEHDVLAGMDFSQYRPWIVLVESVEPDTRMDNYGNWEHLLTAKEYDFVYADGLNRFYLAREKSMLASAFRYPPNIFDEFVTSSQVEAESRRFSYESRLEKAQQEAKHALTCLQGLEERTVSAETRAAYVEGQVQDAQARVHALLRSTSWRVTAPLRFAMRVMSSAVRSVVDAARSLLRKVLVVFASHPSIRAQGVRILAQRPLLHRHLRQIMGVHPDQTQGPPGYLPPRILRIQCLLKAIATQSPRSAAVEGTELQLRPRLAFVSPFPPLRSGIADYSLNLLPALGNFYQIEIVVEDTSDLADELLQTFSARTAEWFMQHIDRYDRVLYHFGNSPLHRYMIPMLQQVRGVVVLHDFFLGDLLQSVQQGSADPFALQKALYQSHGYGAMAECCSSAGVEIAQLKFPANFQILGDSIGVIVHSQYAKKLCNEWYGETGESQWNVIPLMRPEAIPSNRELARHQLGFGALDCIICCFGVMGPTKLNERLIEAWLQSELSSDQCCHLVFVGAVHEGEYGKIIKQVIDSSASGSRIHLTGWVPETVFSQYLAAADIAVQLRMSSRGESSAAVLDCMNHGIATVINAHGTFAEIRADTAYVLPELFDNMQLRDALETLRHSPHIRKNLGLRGQMLVQSNHAPKVCAQMYHQAIEQAYAARTAVTSEMRQMLAGHGDNPLNEDAMVALAKKLARTTLRRPGPRQWLIDVSGTCRTDLRTGIQRVVRAIVRELINNPPANFRVEPVYLTPIGGQWHYRYARSWTSRALDCPEAWMQDDPVEYFDGDVLLIADFISDLAVHAKQAGIFREISECGGTTHFIVYDLLPLLQPQFFPPGQFAFKEWLQALTESADSAICISQSVSHDLSAWMTTNQPQRRRPLDIHWFHLGADIQQSLPTTGFAPGHDQVLERIARASSFLMVGTIEPRKGYIQAIDAFTQLWRQGHDINLVIVGSEGWVHGLPDRDRRTIPHIMHTIRTHPELGNRLIWLNGISDEYLEHVYGASTCLIAASEGEGFGLPLIEAAQHQLPIIARRIPVFQEVAGEHATYFDGLEATTLATAVTTWLLQKQSGDVPDSTQIAWLTWGQSVQSLVQKLNTRLSAASSCV
jgi:FkbM family methyltransferase